VWMRVRVSLARVCAGWLTQVGALSYCLVCLMVLFTLDNVAAKQCVRAHIYLPVLRRGLWSATHAALPHTSTIESPSTHHLLRENITLLIQSSACASSQLTKVEKHTRLTDAHANVKS
jgi:hypothetical protein